MLTTWGQRPPPIAHTKKVPCNVSMSGITLVGSLRDVGHVVVLALPDDVDRLVQVQVPGGHVRAT
jgi:hypothetical protein